MGTPTSDPKAVVHQFIDAMNRRDLEGMLAFIAQDYVSEGKLPPGWHFQGRDRVRENWKDLPQRTNFRAEINGCVSEGDEVWMEVSMFNEREDGSITEMRGVVINVVRNGQITHGRFYIATIK